MRSYWGWARQRERIEQRRFSMAQVPAVRSPVSREFGQVAILRNCSDTRLDDGYAKST
jgi:hypothetical protein